MRTELEECFEYYEFITGKQIDIHAHWTSLNHVNWRRIFLQYRRLKEATGIEFYDKIGNRKFLKRHKL